MKYVYGPVASWRLGRSLGIDLLPETKVCTFNCIYCQVGKDVEYTLQRQVFVPTQEVVKELAQIPDVPIDYVTFSGKGEPTLAANLGEVINAAKNKISKPVAVLTNSSLMFDPQVRRELSLADKVIAKLDAPNEEIFQLINQPIENLNFARVFEGIKAFNQDYPGKLSLQIMFLPQNKNCASQLAKLAKEIDPVEVEINTPTRPTPQGDKTLVLSKEEIDSIKNMFTPLKVYSVYDKKRSRVEPINKTDLEKRRPLK